MPTEDPSEIVREVLRESFQSKDDLRNLLLEEGFTGPIHKAIRQTCTEAMGIPVSDEEVLHQMNESSEGSKLLLGVFRSTPPADTTLFGKHKRDQAISHLLRQHQGLERMPDEIPTDEAVERKLARGIGDERELLYHLIDSCGHQKATPPTISLDDIRQKLVEERAKYRSVIINLASVALFDVGVEDAAELVVSEDRLIRPFKDECIKEILRMLSIDERT